MAATLSFTLHPLRSLLASKQAAKEVASSDTASDELVDVASNATAEAEVRSTSARPRRERINVQSTSRAVPLGGGTVPSEQAQLAARARIDV
jgi:hypothetical protein